MDIIKINQEITNNILLLRRTRDSLRLRAKDKAKTIGEYEKVIAITIVKLKNGIQFELNGNIIENPPTTITEKIAKGICYKESIAKDLAETNYKNAVLALQTIQTIINAYQSMLRYVNEV